MNFIVVRAEHAKHILYDNSVLKKRLRKRRAFSSVALFDKGMKRTGKSIHQYVVIIGCFCCTKLSIIPFVRVRGKYHYSVFACTIASMQSNATKTSQ